MIRGSSAIERTDGRLARTCLPSCYSDTPWSTIFVILNIELPYAPPGTSELFKAAIFELILTEPILFEA
jgi:hypothetical protein